MKRLKVKKIIPILLMVIFIIATFGGCITGPEPNVITFYDYEDQFYAELEKIPKEVEGYALVGTSENQVWEGDILTIEEEYTFNCYSDGSLHIKKNGELINNVCFNISSTDTIQKIFAVYDEFNHRLRHVGETKIIGYKCLNNKLFVLVNTYCMSVMEAFDRLSVKWWPPLLFEYDIDSDTFYYVNYLDAKHYDYHIESRHDYRCWKFDIIEI